MGSMISSDDGNIPVIGVKAVSILDCNNNFLF